MDLFRQTEHFFLASCVCVHACLEVLAAADGERMAQTGQIIKVLVQH